MNYCQAHGLNHCHSHHHLPHPSHLHSAPLSTGEVAMLVAMSIGAVAFVYATAGLGGGAVLAGSSKLLLR